MLAQDAAKDGLGPTCTDERAYVPETPEAWFAGSTTAMAVTEDIVFSKHMIRFGNGSVAPLRYLGNVKKDSPGEFGGFYDLQCVAFYAFEPPFTKRLRRGNALCGPMKTGSEPARPAVYLAAALAKNGKTLDVVFYGNGASSILLSPFSGELCGSFGYIK